MSAKEGDLFGNRLHPLSNDAIARCSVTIRFACAFGVLLWMTAGGCRSRAKQDVYVQNLTGEIRLLEDQLYEADYRNRVLADKLQRQQSRGTSGNSKPVRRSVMQSLDPPIVTHDPTDHGIREGGALVPGPIEEGDIAPPIMPSTIDAMPSRSDIVPAPSPDPLTDSRVPMPGTSSSRFDIGEGLDDLDLNSAIDVGQPVAPEEIERPSADADDNQEGENRSNPFADDGKPFAIPGETPRKSQRDIGDGKATKPAPATSGNDRYQPPRASDFGTPPAFNIPPSEPEPPGKDDTLVPPIVPGEIIPPPVGEPDPEDLPGKVPGLPNSLRELGGRGASPSTLSLHRGFSGAQQYYADDEADGLLLVINVLNEDGRMVDLNDVDIDAELSIVALDPSKPGDEARLARWDFNPAEVRNLVRHVPVSGFHVPVIWDNFKPDVDEVIVHVRLQAGDDVMKCEGTVDIARNARVARWSPRAATSSGGKRAAVPPTVRRPEPARPTRRF